MWMCSLCRLPVAKNHNFAQILTSWGPVPTPFYRWGPNFVCYSTPQHTLTCQISCRSVYSVALYWHKLQFLPFSGLQHLVVSPLGSSLRKLNTGAQLLTFPYPTASKLFLYSNALIAKSGAQPLTLKSVTNKQTDRQTDKNSTFLATPAAGEIRAPPNMARC